MGFAKQDQYGKYYALKEASDKVLDGYSRIGRSVVPQLFFFALLFTILVIFFSIEVLWGNGFIWYLIGVACAMLAVLWFETIRLWRRLAV